MRRPNEVIFDFRLWPEADMLAVGLDVGFRG
jgi:hypothetical protein